MAKSKRMIEVRRARLVREARAGLIPASDDVMNEMRARTNYTARMVRTAKSHLGSVERVSEEHAITDILADLRHYCDHTGLQFKELDAAADALYLEGKTDEAA
ncbi:MAG TPA: hypothetical protein VHX49_00515 [Candidatus Acidoferrales bacterium]|nr:hypothetical protein [Candidatus Acidoferrales bacterium]